jgi:hypothetical protein
MSSRGRNEIYVCVGILILILAIALYAAYNYYGFWPFAIGGFFVAVFAVYVGYSAHKAKHNPPQKTEEPITQPLISAYQRATPEQREKMLEMGGFTKYVDENGRTRWKAPEGGLPEFLKNEKVDLIFKEGTMEVEMQKQVSKIRCSFCGTVYPESLDRCPNCGASRQGNEEHVEDT